MALPQRKTSELPTENPTEAMVEVDYDELFDEREDTSPWCVDHGASITVMSTRQIRAAVSSGELSMAKKAWRDGNACWLEIGEWPELTAGTEAPLALVGSNDDAPSYSSEDEYDIPESGVRRIRRPLQSAPLPLVDGRSVLRASSLLSEPSGAPSLVSIKAAAIALIAVLGAAGCLALGAMLGEPPLTATRLPLAPALRAPVAKTPAPADYQPHHAAASEVPRGFRGRLR